MSVALGCLTMWLPWWFWSISFLDQGLDWLFNLYMIIGSTFQLCQISNFALNRIQWSSRCSLCKLADMDKLHFCFLFLIDICYGMRNCWTYWFATTLFRLAIQSLSLFINFFFIVLLALNLSLMLILHVIRNVFNLKREKGPMHTSCFFWRIGKLLKYLYVI